MIPVTIITVSYNSENTIKRTIESVLSQTYPAIEYLLIDGASSDQTCEIAESYQKDFAKKGFSFHIISEKDRGMYDALNKGIAKASGVLIGSINADDWYEPNIVEEMVRHYEEDKFDIAWSDIVIHKGDKRLIKHAKNGWLKTTSGFCHPSMFATKETLIKLPYANKQMDDDFDFILRANKAGKVIKVYSQILSNYTFGGMSTKKSLSDMHARIRMKYRTYRRNGYSAFYWFYCVAIELAKYVLG